MHHRTSFLERRVEHLLTLLKEEKLHLLSEDRYELVRDLYNMKMHPNGHVDISSCTPVSDLRLVPLHVEGCA